MVDYEAGTYTFTRETVGTRYVVVGVRTLVEPNDPKDLEKVHALQDAIKVEHANPAGSNPQLGSVSQKRVRKHSSSSAHATRLRRMFGTRTTSIRCGT